MVSEFKKPEKVGELIDQISDYRAVSWGKTDLALAASFIRGLVRAVDRSNQGDAY